MSLNEKQKPSLEDEVLQLRQQLAEYEAIFDSGTIMFWYKDLHNCHLRVNHTASALDGLTPHQMEGKTGEELYSKEQAEAYYKDDLEVINSGKPKLNIIESHISPHTQEIHWLKVSKIPSRDEFGNINGVIAYAAEVTDTDKSDIETAQSRALLDSIINGIYDPIFVKDEQHRYLVLNDTMCEMMKQSRSELIGKSDYEFFSKEQADVFWTHDDLVFGSSDVDRNEEQFTREGQTRTISTIKSSFLNPLTGKRNLVGSIRDITERKQTEIELRQLRSYLESVIDSMPSIMIGVAEDGSVTQWNSAAERVTGITKNDAIGQQLSKVFPRLAQDLPRVYEAITTCREIMDLKRSYQQNDKTYYEDVIIYP